MDALCVATGVQPDLSGSCRRIRAPSSFPIRISARAASSTCSAGRSARSSCECERRSDVSLVQALNLVNGTTISDAVADENGRVAKLVLRRRDGPATGGELYLASLEPSAGAARAGYAETYLAAGTNRAERAQDLLWALLNSNAFLFNY